MIGIIDYGMGNLGSVSNACAFLEFDSRILTRADDMDDCAAVILPGVGAFGDCMEHLRDHGFVDPIKEWIAADKPFLGICLGLQVLYEGSDESPGVDGLGVFPGVIPKFDLSKDYKVPQIGWNQVRQAHPECPLFKDIPDKSYFYFVHSFHAPLVDEDFIAGVTDYGYEYTSAVWRGNMAAVQFHPEKSQKMGLAMLKNFASWIGEGVPV